VNGNDLLSIGAFAQSTGLSIAALRHYDEIELLKPALVDPDTGYRRYAPDQLDQARLICGLRGVDLPIDEIRAVLGQPATNVRSALDVHRERLVAQLRELSQRLRAVDELIDTGELMPALQAVRPVQIRITVPDVGRAAAFYTTAFDVVFNEDISSLQFGTNWSHAAPRGADLATHACSSRSWHSAGTFPRAASMIERVVPSFSGHNPAYVFSVIIGVA